MAAVHALDKFHAALFESLTGFVLINTIGPQDLAIAIFASEMSIGLEHVRHQTSPYHQLDRTLGYPFFDHVGNSGMPEDMRSNAFLDARTLRNPLELKIDRSVREGIILLGDEDRQLGIHRLAGIIVLP